MDIERSPNSFVSQAEHRTSASSGRGWIRTSDLSRVEASALPLSYAPGSAVTIPTALEMQMRHVPATCRHLVPRTGRDPRSLP